MSLHLQQQHVQQAVSEFSSEMQPTHAHLNFYLTCKNYGHIHPLVRWTKKQVQLDYRRGNDCTKHCLGFWTDMDSNLI